MQAVKQKVVVKANGTIELAAGEFRPGTVVEVIVLGDKPVKAKAAKRSFWSVVRKLKINDGPPDWSSNFDKYLYGER